MESFRLFCLDGDGLCQPVRDDVDVDEMSLPAAELDAADLHPAGHKLHLATQSVLGELAETWRRLESTSERWGNGEVHNLFLTHVLDILAELALSFVVLEHLRL